jgi:hypothetical protein
MKPLRYLPDVISAISALLLGLALALFLHNRWYYHGRMSWFGDPPMSNPAYARFVDLFVSFPYIAAGSVAGLLSGFGRSQPACFAVRSSGLMALFIVLLSRNSHLAVTVFLPVAVAGFVVSFVLSLLHLRLSSHAQISTVA